MKRTATCTLVTTMALVALASMGMADVPPMVNYQAYLTDAGGAPLDTTVSIVFTIYDDSVAGDAMWTETHPSVTAVEGSFSVILGQTAPIYVGVFSDPNRWLGIQVGMDPELMPRTRLVSAPYAFRVSTVDGSTGGIISGNVSIQSDLMVSGKATIGPDHANTGLYAFVAGENSVASGSYSTVGGGHEDTASGEASAIGGGSGNKAGGPYSTVGGGAANTANGDWSTVGGGIQNTAFINGASVGGGYDNTAYDYYSTVGGGYQNTASADYSTVGGGYQNYAANDYATVAGGLLDSASGFCSSVGGGNGNVASSFYSTVPGGWDNLAAGECSFAAGRKAKANHNGTLVWADDTNADFASTGQNQFLIRASGGVGIGTNSPQGALDVSSTSGAFIVPRMTTAQRDALTAVNGMIIYNTTTDQFNFYEAGAWVTK